jgi:hypothetical protein
MDCLVTAAAGIKRALQEGEWAQRDFEYQQEAKRILESAQQPGDKEEAQAQAEAQLDAQAQLQAATKELKSKRTAISKLSPLLVKVVTARSALRVCGYPACRSPVFFRNGVSGYVSDCYLTAEDDKEEEEEKGEKDEPEEGEAKEGEEVLQEEEAGPESRSRS